MLTDQQARDLLHLAADTVEVERTAAMLASPRRPVWPLVAAAASVVLVVGGLFVLVRSGDEDPEPAPSPAVTDDGQFRLGPDQVPSVFGYTEGAAVQMLERRGFEVEVAAVPNECDEAAGRATGIDPRPGTVVEPGAVVTVYVPGRSSIIEGSGFCVLDTYRRDEAWALLDYANGRGEAPATAPGVDLGPLLERLRVWSGEVGRYETGRFGQSRLRWPTPLLTTTRAEEFSCRGAHRLDGREVLALTVALDLEPTGGVGPIGQCPTVFVEFGDDGAIADVVVPDSYASEDHLVPADVVGNTVAFATERLESQGLRVESVRRADCQPIGVITAQQPFPDVSSGLAPGSTVVVAYTNEVGPCLEPGTEIETPARDAAEGLVAFATGGELPPVADSIDLYIANMFEKRLAGDLASDPDEWATGCGSPTGPCDLNMLDVFGSGPVAVTQPFVRENGPCYVVSGTLPDELSNPEALARSASFGDPEPRTCADNWEAQLWLDDQGRIFAVNLLSGNPSATD